MRQLEVRCFLLRRDSSCHIEILVILIYFLLRLDIYCEGEIFVFPKYFFRLSILDLTTEFISTECPLGTV